MLAAEAGALLGAAADGAADAAGGFFSPSASAGCAHPLKTDTPISERTANAVILFTHIAHYFLIKNTKTTNNNISFMSQSQCSQKTFSQAKPQQTISAPLHLPTLSTTPPRPYTRLMGMYRDLGRNPGVFRVLASQLTARFPFGMLSIILLLHIQLAYGDYTSAGIVLATQSAGQAISGPVASRLMGRWGMRPVLTATAIVCSGLLVTIALAHLPLLIVAGLAFLTGITTPPVTPAVRTLYPKLVPGNQLTALFSLDAAAQELIWVVGPVVAVLVTSQFGTAVGLCVAASFMLLGGAWFILTPSVGTVKIPRSRHSLGAILRRPTVLISTTIGFFFVASFAAIEAGIVSAFTPAGEGTGHGSIESGVVLALFAGGSLVGGLLFGHRPLRPWSLLSRIAIVFVGTMLCLVSLNIWWLGAVLFLGGIGTAPTFAAVSSMISSSVKFSETAEAFGWIGTGQLVGVAVGSAFAGIAIDTAGAQGAILVSAGLLLICVIVAALTVRWVPDLKDGYIEVPPETGTLAIPLP